MSFSIEKIKKMPISAKVGLALWIVSWAGFIAVYYTYTKDTQWVYRLSAAVVILAIFLSQAQNWSRILAILANGMGGALSSLFFMQGLVGVAAMNILLFGSAIYFLMVPQTVAYYKAQSQPASPPSDK